MGQLVVEPTAFNVAADRSQSVTVNLSADSLGNFSQDLVISSNDGNSPQTVSVQAEVKALLASTQVLTATGSVSNLSEGQIKVEILNSDGNSIFNQTGQVER